MSAAAEETPTPPKTGGPVLSPPPVHWTDRWRAKLPEGSWRRRRYDTLFLPIGPPVYFTQSKAALVAELTPEPGDASEDRAKEVLEEAQALYDGVDDRITGAQTRATTLQGAVAVAASLVLAGGSLLADPSKVQGAGWRWWLALSIVGVVVSLVMTGVRALAATSRIHVFHHPSPPDILVRARLPVTQARIELAAELLQHYGRNTKVGDWKVAHLGAAAWWFRWALVLLVSLALALGSYAVLGADEEEPAATAVVSTGPTGASGAVRPSVTTTP